jgi:DtxR family Mn-dependent transcriptional regulator
MAELSEPLENYLKEIYELESVKGYAKVTDLILAFQVSSGTISKAISRLESLGLILRNNRGIKLTDDGRKIAERLVKSHRISERLLTDIIGLDWIRAHEIAHRLEHIWPEDVLDKIDEVLGYPKTCPHGHPIPGREEVKGIQLNKVKPGKYIVVMIIKEEEWVLREAEELGLKPGNIISIIRENDKIFLDSSGKMIEIPKTIAEQVLVDART